MIRLNKEQITELKEQVRRGHKDNRYFKRVQIVYLKAQGRQNKEIVEICATSTSTINRLSMVYKKKGLAGLRSNYEGSHYRKMTYNEETAILEKLKAEAEVGQYVRGVDLQKKYIEMSGVEYSLRGFYGLLHRHGWRKLKPRGQHPKKASEEAIDASKKLTKPSGT